MNRTVPLLVALALPLSGCMAPMKVLKLTYLAVSTVAKAVELVADEPEQEELEDDE